MAKLDQNFEKTIAYILEQLTQTAKALKGEEGRQWMLFDDRDTPSKYTYKSVHQRFRRDEANAQYLKARQDTEGKELDIVTAKLQIDWLAALSRDFRARHRSRVRTFMHQASRADGQSLPEGPISQHTIGFLRRLLKMEGT